jgi:S-adenosylmethionine hydrolase
MSAPPWQPCGLVSLLSDFGLEDAYVGVMKAVILSAGPGLRPIDLTHGVRPQDVRQASWHLAHSWPYFPAGSVHLAVVDPGVGTEREILVARDRGHVFLAPDNGLLGPVLSAEAEVRALDQSRFALPGASATFHGRDLFAPAAAALAGGLDPARAGKVLADWRRSSFPAPREEAGAIRTEVLFADRYGNLVTPFERSRLPGDPSGFEVEVAGRRMPLARTYADAPEGECLALFGSAASLEVSLRGGDAARALGAGPGTPVFVHRRIR